MTPHTNTLLVATAVGAGAPMSPRLLKEGQTTVVVQASFVAGTGTITVEGRNEPTDDWVVLATFSADGVQSVAACTQLRANCTAATGLTARITSPTPFKP